MRIKKYQILSNVNVNAYLISRVKALQLKSEYWRINGVNHARLHPSPVLIGEL